MGDLIGLGLYTPAEAGKLLRVPTSKITRWLRGHSIDGKSYPALWKPEVDLGDDRLILGFRDLMEVRVADAFIRAGVSAIRVRTAIQIAREALGQDHPLSTDRFRTDGREIFLRIFETGPDGEERERLLNLFRRQYEFKGIIDPILKTVDFGEDGNPLLWWPGGRRLNVVVDPSRSFGQPIDASSSVPTNVLAAAAQQEGIIGAARAYEVPEASVRRAIEFETSLGQRMAA
ncbi:hypothetical protein HGO38_18055 [Rhizobium sp. CG5]|uniref:hypothetical protein n=1 Tax=Rhizobium sp. CG5 TaxID=2726076 RepID=UPI0020344F1E|nr:hypothetical protein [Rhizobium sp. CG5]MCM2475388.1 hypothetical protein [Rhizobium sp. CG5]